MEKVLQERFDELGRESFGRGQGARIIIRKFAQTGMTFSRSECEQPKAWHQPVEQSSCVDKHGDEQMVPVLQQGPPTKKFAVPGVPIPSGLRQQIHGVAAAPSTPSPRSRAQIDQSQSGHVDAKDTTRVPNEIGKPLLEKCGILEVYMELTVDRAWGSALEAAAAAEIFKVSMVIFTREKA